MTHRYQNYLNSGTDEYFFYYDNVRGWTSVEDLTTDDDVILYSGEEADIQSISVEQFEKPITVYNLEVEDWHTYFVSDINVLVHNDCPGSDGVGSIISGTDSISYTRKVIDQMYAGTKDYHTFPVSIDAFLRDGIITRRTGGDGVTRTWIEISGTYMGATGVFQYIFEPTGICNHRYFSAY